MGLLVRKLSQGKWVEDISNLLCEYPIEILKKWKQVQEINKEHEIMKWDEAANLTIAERKRTGSAWCDDEE